MKSFLDILNARKPFQKRPAMWLHGEGFLSLSFLRSRIGFARLPWHERLILFMLIVLIAWESILGAYKFSEFPYSAIDFFQHYFLGQHVNRGGSIANTDWPQQIGDLLGHYLPPSMQRTAPYLHYQLLLLPLFRILALMPMSIAYAVWLIVALLLVGWVGAQVASEIGIKRSLLLFALFLWPPIWHVLILGNADVFVWVLMNLGWINFMREREERGGFWMGLAALIKGFPAFAVIPWLIRKPWPALRGFTAGILIGIGWGALGSGAKGWLFMARHISDYQQALIPFMPANNSILAVLWALMGPSATIDRGLSYHGLFRADASPDLLSALHLALSFLLITLAWRSTQRSPRSPFMGQSGAWLSMGLLIWPVSWINYHIYLFTPVAWLIAHREQLRYSTRIMLYVAMLPITAALSYGFLANVTAPYMLMPILMAMNRLLFFWIFQRSTSEVSHA